MNYLRNLINALLGRKPNNPSKLLVFVTQPQDQATQGINPGYYCSFQCMHCAVKYYCNNISTCPNCGKTRWTVRQVCNYDNTWLPACEDFIDNNGQRKRYVCGIGTGNVPEWHQKTFVPDKN